MEKHYVYMIEERGAVTDLSVKIGVSRDVCQRVDDMQTGNPRILRVAQKIGPFSEREAFATEKKLHKCFRKFHVRGEWFDAVILDRMCMLEKYENHQRSMRSGAKKSKKERKKRIALEAKG